MGNMLIKNATIVPMTDLETVIENGYIYVEANKIKAVASGPAPESYEHAEKVIDGAGMVAIPGLINGHTHTPMSMLRGFAGDLPLMNWLQEMWAVEAKMSTTDMYWTSLLSMAEMIQSGTTTFVDMYYGMEQIATATERVGLRALLSQGIIERENDGEALLAETSSFVESWHHQANDRIHALLSPHAPYTCSPLFIEKIIDRAHELDCAIHTHLAETEDEIDIITEKYGETPMQLMENIGLFTRHVIAAHGVYVTDDDMAILKERKVGIIHNPKSNLKLGSGIAPIKKYLQHGILVGLGTDGAASNNVLDMFEEMRFASLLQKGIAKDPTALPAHETLTLGTSLGAEAIGLRKDIGTIEAGKKADLVLVDLSKPHVNPVNDVVSHLIYSVKAEDVAYTIVDGNILLENKELTMIDVEEVIWHVNKIKSKLFSS